MATFSVTSLIKETRRRRVFRVAGFYVVSAWVVLQVADLAFPTFNLPESALRYVWYGAVLGFPIAIIFGWRFDIVGGRILHTPGSTHEVDLSLNRIDYVILSAFSIVIIAITVGLVGGISGTQTSESGQIQTEEYDPASIAVLPFVNMSPDPNNEYFADGLSEELLNGLANVEGLRVTARTSSFSFKNQNMDVREIGRKLNVANILEGSVRVAGDTFRVTAQLVDSRNGVHRWSQTYDRSMLDVFAIQDDISRNIVLALKDALVINEASPSSVSTTENPEAYSYYLRGRVLLREYLWPDQDTYEQAIGLFRQAVDIDPKFSAAFVALADAHFGYARSYSNKYMPIEADAEATLARDALRVAIGLAPESSEAMRALGTISDDEVESEKALRQAIAINPNNVDATLSLGYVLLGQRNAESGAKMIRRAHVLDPLNHEIMLALGYVLNMEGKLKESSTYYRLATEHKAPLAAEEYAALLESRANLPELPSHMDFEVSSENWWLQEACRDNYEYSISDISYSGQGSGYFVSLPKSRGWCNTAQRISANRYLGKYVQLTGMIRTEGLTGFSKLWMRADGPTGQVSFDDRWPDFVTADTDWIEYELQMYVPDDTVVISFGAVLAGEGEMWMDDFRLEAFENPDFQ